MPTGSKVMVANEPFRVLALELLPFQESVAMPGVCVERSEDRLTVQVGDGLVRLQVEPLVMED